MGLSSSSAKRRRPSIKPIIGMEAYVAPNRRFERSTGGGSGNEYAFHLTLLARTGEGVRNLHAAVLEVVPGGVLLQAPDRQGDPGTAQRGADLPVRLRLGLSSRRFDPARQDGRGREAMRRGIRSLSARRTSTSRSRTTASRSSSDCDGAAVDLARRLGLPLVATSDAHYLEAGRRTGARRLAVHQHRQDRRPAARQAPVRRRSRQLPTSSTSAAPTRCTPRSPAAMTRPSRTSARIAEMVEENYVSWAWGSGSSPRSSRPRRRPPRTTCASSARQGLRERYGDSPPAEARERLEHELGIINRMGFASYFLIVWDFVRYAREKGIPAFGQRFRLRRAGQLRALSQQRLSAQV